MITTTSFHTYARSPVALVAGEGMVARDAEAGSTSTLPPASALIRWGTATPHGCACPGRRLPCSTPPTCIIPSRAALAQALCARTGLDAVFSASGCRGQRGCRPQIQAWDTYGPAPQKVITLVNSFHGRTLATLTATGQDVFHHDFGPFPANFGLCTRRRLCRAGKGYGCRHLRCYVGVGAGRGRALSRSMRIMLPRSRRSAGKDYSPHCG